MGDCYNRRGLLLTLKYVLGRPVFIVKAVPGTTFTIYLVLADWFLMGPLLL